VQKAHRPWNFLAAGVGTLARSAFKKQGEIRDRRYFSAGFQKDRGAPVNAPVFPKFY
jgi:hypothetical protein